MELIRTRHGVITYSCIAECICLGHSARPQDRREVEDISGQSLEANLFFALAHAKPCLTARTKENKLLGIFGVIPTVPREGAIAMIGTQEIERNRHSFLRGSRDVLAYLHKDYDRLYNVVDARNTLHVEYLKWLGFKMGKHIEQFGHAKIPVIEFERRIK